MDRPIADAVLPYLDTPVQSYIESMEKSSKSEDRIALTLAKRHRVFFPDRRAIDFTLDHVDSPTTMKYGTRPFTPAERSYVRSSFAYKNHPKKLRPDDLSVSAAAWLDLFMWGGDNIFSAIDQPKQYRGNASSVRLSMEQRNVNDPKWRDNNSALINDMKGGTLAEGSTASLFATDWLMDTEITNMELILLLAPYFSYSKLDMTVRDFIPILSQTILRGMLAQHTSKYHGYGDTLVRVWETINQKFGRDVASQWFMVAQGKFPRYRDHDDEPIIFGSDIYHITVLSREYSPADVAPFVIDGYPISTIKAAMDNDIDLFLIRAVMGA